MKTSNIFDNKFKIVLAAAGTIIVAIFTIAILCNSANKDAKDDSKKTAQNTKSQEKTDTQKQEELAEEYVKLMNDFDTKFKEYASSSDLAYVSPESYDYSAINQLCRVELSINEEIDNSSIGNAIQSYEDLNPKITNALSNLSKCKEIVDNEIESLTSAMIENANKDENAALEESMNEAISVANVLIKNSDYTRKTLREKLMESYSEPVSNYAVAKCDIDWIEQAKKISANYIKENKDAKSNDLVEFLQSQQFNEDEITAAKNYNVDLKD